jgi:hypothetical protein
MPANFINEIRDSNKYLQRQLKISLENIKEVHF